MKGKTSGNNVERIETIPGCRHAVDLRRERFQIGKENCIFEKGPHGLDSVIVLVLENGSSGPACIFPERGKCLSRICDAG